MLFQFPVLYSVGLQQLIVVLNSSLLIIVLAAAEMSESTWLSDVRSYLREFYPLLAVLLGLLVFAAVKQLGAA